MGASSLHPRPVPGPQHQESRLSVQPEPGSPIPRDGAQTTLAAAFVVLWGGPRHSRGSAPESTAWLIYFININSWVALASKERFVFTITGDFTAEITILYRDITGLGYPTRTSVHGVSH